MKENQNQIRITNQKLATWLVYNLPFEVEPARIAEYKAQIDSLPKPQQYALKCAYIFSQKVPKQERADMFSDLVVGLLEHDVKDAKLMYAVARCDWKNWWALYKIRSHYGFISLEEPAGDKSQVEAREMVRLGDILAGEMEFEIKICNRLDAKVLLSRLPKDILRLGKKRLLGKALNSTERSKLNRYLKANPMVVAEAQS